VDCEDPRPRPLSTTRQAEQPITVEVMVPEPVSFAAPADSQVASPEVKELTEGEALEQELQELARSAGGRRVGTETPRPGQNYRSRRMSTARTF